MKKNLEILDYEDKKTKDGKRYCRFKTSDGKNTIWMSCFDSVSIEAIKKLENKVACLEIVESGEFKNIKKCHGERSIDLDERNKEYDATHPEEKPEVVKMSEPKTKNNYPKDPVGLAVDVFCAILGKMSLDNQIEARFLKDSMKESIELVKQAKEAFE